MGADLYKLVHGTHTGQDSPVANHYVTCHLGIITHDTIISYDTIVGEVAIGLDQAVLADNRPIPVLCAPVNRHKFPYGSTVADHDLGIFTLEFQVLRNSSDHSSREYAAILADPGSLHNGYIRTDPGAITYFNVLMYNCEGVNLHIRRQFCVRMNVCMRMDHESYYKKVTFVSERDGQS
jgi:hypothetical protein